MLCGYEVQVNVCVLAKVHLNWRVYTCIGVALQLIDGPAVIPPGSIVDVHSDNKYRIKYL